MSYTFTNVRANHTIQAVFVPDTEPPTPTPTGDDNVRMYVKLDGVWVPLFEETN